MARHLGVTVLPEYVQSEGCDSVLSNIADTLGATAINTSPYVAAACPPGEGHREPPVDAGAGDVRLLDRRLWGASEVWMKTAPAFAPNNSYYGQGPYRPDPADTLTYVEKDRLTEFLSAARLRGLSTSLQIMAAIPPCYRVQFGGPVAEDQPLMPDGQPVPDRVDRNASLASVNLRRYMRGLIRDLCEAFPDVDALRFDWPEYPPYDFRSLTADYNPQVAPFAQEIGIDLQSLQAAISNGHLERRLAEAFVRRLPLATVLEELRTRDRAIDDHFRLRAHLVVRYTTFLSDTVTEASGGRVDVILQGFPPPWSLLSGFDAAADGARKAIKFYTMHWPMIGANYAEHISTYLDLPRTKIDTAIRRNLLGATDLDRPQLRYPGPQTPHDIDAEAIIGKVSAFNSPEVVGISHSYGPSADVVARFAALYAATDGRIEINRYGYLSDEKILALRRFLDTQDHDMNKASAS